MSSRHGAIQFDTLREQANHSLWCSHWHVQSLQRGQLDKDRLVYTCWTRKGWQSEVPSSNLFAFVHSNRFPQLGVQLHTAVVRLHELEPRNSPGYREAHQLASVNVLLQVPILDGLVRWQDQVGEFEHLTTQGGFRPCSNDATDHIECGSATSRFDHGTNHVPHTSAEPPTGCLVH